MYYEIYMDVVFVTNLIMDYFLLRLVDRVLRFHTTRGRSFLGAAAGALGVCLLLVLPWPGIWWRNLLGYAVTNTLMVRIGCKIRDKKKLIQGVAALFGMTFLCGGIMTALMGSPVAASLRTFLFLSTAAYLVLSLFLWGYGRWKTSRGNLYDVTLYANGTSKKVRGLYDTGNQLADPYTGTPVSIIHATVLEEFFQEPIWENEALKPHYVTYHSIGQKEGVLLAVTLESMTIDVNGTPVEIRHPILALSQDTVSYDQHYQIILNPNLIDN
ncbi:MAG: sigma-E processing peptidase SpoIIGA [Lachnospiraceae bacterium]|nr:sigma-E processing peptidase SpoIIGA [Lachnospiraceae bacterium]